MKKLFIVFVLFLCCFNCFAQKFDESARIQKGDITLLDSQLSDLALAKMDNSELRILRNMIFAKYGHTFNSDDLKVFFSQFEWYKPGRKVSETEFTENEKYLLERIKIFETRNENSKTIKFGNEIIGLWHDTPVMPDTWSGRILIYPNKRIEFLLSYFVTEYEDGISEYLGNYEIKGNVIICTVTKVVKNKETVVLKSPLVLKFPITSIEEVVFGNGVLVRQMIKIGSIEYYLYDNDTENMGERSRQY